jgi:hypothetical protein
VCKSVCSVSLLEMTVVVSLSLSLLSLSVFVCSELAFFKAFILWNNLPIAVASAPSIPSSLTSIRSTDEEIVFTYSTLTHSLTLSSHDTLQNEPSPISTI